MKSQTTISPGDFFTGFFSALAVREHKAPLRCGPRFDAAMEAAFEALAQRSEQTGIETSFLIIRHPLHRNSSVVHDGINGAIRRDLISLDNPSFQKITTKLSPEDAATILTELPGGRALYETLVDDFLQSYDASLVTA
jgi:hypothetical protein